MQHNLRSSGMGLLAAHATHLLQSRTFNSETPSLSMSGRPINIISALNSLSFKFYLYHTYFDMIMLIINPYNHINACHVRMIRQLNEKCRRCKYCMWVRWRRILWFSHWKLTLGPMYNHSHPLTLLLVGLIDHQSNQRLFNVFCNICSYMDPEVRYTPINTMGMKEPIAFQSSPSNPRCRLNREIRGLKIL